MPSEIDLEFNSSEVKPFLAMPVFGSIPPGTVKSLLETVLMLKSKKVRFEISFNCGSSVIEVSRNILADEFLNSDCDRIFWLDADLEWNAKDFFTVLGLSSIYEAVGASYRFKEEAVRFSMRLEHTGSVDLNEHGLIGAKGSGMGFVCITRKVMEAMAKSAPRFKLDRNSKNDMAQVFHTSIGEDSLFYGEDMDFFRRMTEAGFEYLLYPHAKLGHVGNKVFEGALADWLRGDGTDELVEETVRIVDSGTGLRGVS